MSQSHLINGGNTDEVFQEQCFPWEVGASVAADFLILKTPEPELKTLKGKRSIKRN